MSNLTTSGAPRIKKLEHIQEYLNHPVYDNVCYHSFSLVVELRFNNSFVVLVGFVCFIAVFN